MTDTNQLPEPELGYIKTDKSNQPAFSARQMLEAMKHAPQPTQATQTELTDEQILEIAEPFGAFEYGDAQGDKRIDFARAILALRPERVPMTCHCHTCRPITMDDMRMVLCPKCGNKRCPHANDHRNDCTGSNEPGQPGSAYPAPHGITAQAKKDGA